MLWQALMLGNGDDARYNAFKNGSAPHGILAGRVSSFQYDLGPDVLDALDEGKASARG